MTEPEILNHTPEETLLRRYLLGELNQLETDDLEERFGNEQSLFERVLGVENELIDGYVSNRMPERERRLFELNYLVTAEKREKVAHAATLQTFLKNRTAKKPDVVKASQKQPSFFRQKLIATFAAPAFWQYSVAGLLVLLTFSSGLLVIDRIRLSDNAARLQNNVSLRESELESQLTTAHSRETELQNQLNEKNGESQNLIDELGNERQTRERLEDEIEKIKPRKTSLPKQNQGLPPQTPELAAIILRPQPRQGEMTTAIPGSVIAVPKNITGLSLKLILPSNAKTDARFAVEFNGLPVASNLIPKIEPNDTKILRFVLSGKNISRNASGEASQITVKDAAKNVIANYSVEFKPQP